MNKLQKRPEYFCEHVDFRDSLFLLQNWTESMKKIKVNESESLFFNMTIEENILIAQQIHYTRHVQSLACGPIVVQGQIYIKYIC